MSRVRILGIGSPSGDDQAGWLTVDALRDAGVSDNDQVFIEKLDRPGANLIALLENAAWVIVVDATHSNSQIGRVQRFGQEDWPDYQQGLSSHGLGVIDALKLACELGCLPAKLDLYGIEIGEVVPGEVPGRCIQAATRQLAYLIANDLQQTLAA